MGNSSPTTGSTAAGGKDGQLGLPVVNSFNNKGRGIDNSDEEPSPPFSGF